MYLGLSHVSLNHISFILVGKKKPELVATPSPSSSFTLKSAAVFFNALLKKPDIYILLCMLYSTGRCLL